MNDLNLFRSLIYKDTYDFDYSKLLPLMKQGIQKSVHEEKLDYDTTSPDIQPHTWQQFEPFLYYVKEKTDEIWKDWNLYPFERFVTSSHINRQCRGEAVREHAHGGVDIVVVAYISAEQGTGNIEFRDPLEYAWQNLPKDTHPRDVWREVEVKTNDVLFFPGFLNHRTQINQTDNDRWTLNLMIRSRLATGV